MLSLHKFLFESMLNRRILRIKAFKAIYSYAENPGMTMGDTEALLEHSCESVRDLYLFMMSVIVPVTKEASARITAAQNKFNPTEEELHPNLKFVNNRLAAMLEEDPDFQKMISRKKLSWEQYDMFLRHLYENIRERDYFKRYLEAEEDSLAKDAKLWVKIFENEFEDNAELVPILEELSIYWNDDLSYALIWCCKTLENLGKGQRWELPALYQSDADKKTEDDKAFVIKLVRAAYSGFGKYYEKIAGSTPKWDKSRICATDLALIVCGLAEADTFRNIASSITINEFVEISKYYSTPESRGFVNGVLDKLINKH